MFVMDPINRTRILRPIHGSHKAFTMTAVAGIGAIWPKSSREVPKSRAMGIEAPPCNSEEDAGRSKRQQSQPCHQHLEEEQSETDATAAVVSKHVSSVLAASLMRLSTGRNQTCGVDM